jgi:hypothetical protein
MKAIDIFHDDGPIDIAIIHTFEQELGYLFPKSYKELLSEHNALYPEESDFKYVFEGEKNVRDVTFLGYGDEISSASQISRVQQIEYCYDHIVVIGVAANGDYICFDYRSDTKTDNPPVVLMFHDYADENNKMAICRVADNFEAFIDSLYQGDDEDQ